MCIIAVSLLTKPEQSWSKNRQVECKCLFCAVTTYLKPDLLHPTILVHHLSSTNHDNCTKTHGSFVATEVAGVSGTCKPSQDFSLSASGQQGRERIGPELRFLISEVGHLQKEPELLTGGS